MALGWQQDRSEAGEDGRLDLGRDLADLIRLPGRHVFLVKLSYWFGG